MLDIGWSELLVVAVVAVVVVGPKELPKLMRTFGFYAGKVRRAASDFRRQFDEAMAESEADEVGKNIEAIRSNMGTTADFNQPIDNPLMTPMSEPGPTAPGERPHLVGEDESSAARKPQRRPAKGWVAKKARAKTSGVQTSGADSTKPPKGKTSAKRTTKGSVAAKRATKRKAKAASPRTTKTGGA